MDAKFVRLPEGSFVECLPDGQLLQTGNDFLDLIASCGEHLCDRLVIPAGLLPDTFYDLKTGLAGELLQKLVNYRVKTAVLVDMEKAGNGRFYEMMIESNRGRQFHFSDDRDAALIWLLNEG